MSGRGAFDGEGLQEKFETKDAALRRALELRHAHAYVCVIDSPHESGRFWYVETEPSFVRAWEETIVTYLDGVLVRGDV